MEYRLNINKVTPKTREWTCKVQLIEKARARQSKDGRTRFQIMIAQDETEEQVAVVLYGDEIEKYENKLTPFNTYLISSAKVRAPLPYGIPVNTFEWVLDKFTVVEQVKQDNIEDPPLPAPTRLNTISLAHLEKESQHVEFDILAVVVSCGAIKVAGIHGNKCRQIIVMDTNMHQCIFTLWEDFAEIDGNELAAQIENHPVILAKRIARSSYAGTSLTTRYNSTILINPFYPQAAELMNWVKDNEEMLNTYTQRSSPETASSPILISLNDEAIPIENIQTQPAMQSFHVEGKLSLLDDDEQLFYELMCSKCKHFVRTKIIKVTDCVNCDQRAMLTPRCRFQVQITDASGSTIATLLGEPGENLLSMKAEQIYEITNIKKEPFPLQHIQHHLADKVFKVQLKKSYLKNSHDTPPKLFVLSFTEKQHIVQLPTPSASQNAGKSSKRELDNLSSSEESKNLTIGSISSSKRQQTEHSTLIKKNVSSTKSEGIEPVTPTKKK